MNPERKLVHLVTIKSLNDAANADALSVARMHEVGWQCIVKKGDFEVGEQAVFIEIDAVLPKERPEFLFLTKGTEDYLLRTVKLRGNLSQGLLIKFPSHLSHHNPEIVTDAFFGVKQREPREDFSTGEFCDYFPKTLAYDTSRSRIQNAPHIVDKIKGRPFWKTIKMDGKSATYLWKNGELCCCSHNMQIKESKDSIFWKIAEKYNLKNNLPKNLVLQGEICGPGVEKNKAKLSELTLFIFDAKSTETTSYFNWANVLEIARDMGIPAVNSELITFAEDVTLEDLLDMADAAKFETLPAEGLVFRSKMEEWDETLGRFSFKVISNNYLLKG